VFLQWVGSGDDQSETDQAGPEGEDDDDRQHEEDDGEQH
jgi:hypothetical protein